MNTKSGQKEKTASSNETRITALTLLKNFYDEQIFNILIRDFFNSNPEVSLAAINASASIGNEAAIPHLCTIIEKGSPAQKKAAIQTLTKINAPSSIDRLVDYFTFFQDREIRRELLRSIAIISPLHPKTLELNRALLQDTSSGQEYFDLVLPALLEAGELELVKNNLAKANPEVRRSVFTKLLDIIPENASTFIEHFRDQMHQFDPHTLGCFLCAYELKIANPRNNFVIDTLQSVDPRATTSFMITLSGYQGRVENPQRLYRLLLRLPYVDMDTESLTGDFLSKIMEEVKQDSPLLLNEFTFSTATNLEAVFAKLKSQYVSLKGIKEKDSLLAVVFTKLLEQYATAELLKETQSFFKSDAGSNAAAVIARLREMMIAAPSDDKNRMEACLRLFAFDGRIPRLNVLQILSRANLNTPLLARRLNRLVRLVGTLEIRNSGKKVLEVLNFAREERVAYLEETAIVSLCQLLNRTAIEHAQVVFGEIAKYPISLRGYIRAARFIPAKFFINPLLKLLLNPKIPGKIRALIVESLETMNLADIRGALPLLIRALTIKEIEENLKENIAGILTTYADSVLFQPLVDLTTNKGAIVRGLGVRVLKALARKDKNLSTDVLTNRLYLLLEDSDHSVRIEALLALLAMEDDFAIQVLDDYIEAQDEAAAVDILKNLGEEVSHELMERVLKLLNSGSKRVHEELRHALPPFCQGPLSEDIRNGLLAALKADLGSAAVAAVPRAGRSPSRGIMQKAKLDFKLRRESEQVLTVFFIDIVQFTKKTIDAEAIDMITLVQGFEKITLPTIERLNGSVVKTMGDGLLAVFKHPLNAALAALEIQKQVREHNELKVEAERFHVRIGLNSGRVIRKEGDVFGKTVNVASRMENLADPGDIYLTQATYEEIKEYIRCTQLGQLEVKGVAGGIVAYSAQEPLIDIDKVVSEPKVRGEAVAGAQDAGSLLNLQESMFKPQFDLPAELEDQDSAVFASLVDLFEDLSSAVEKISEDYHDDYVFKRYLQEKWNEILKSADSEQGETPQAPAEATV
jgi:class 3 adenylate cyclase/HEAT repeat protein